RKHHRIPRLLRTQGPDRAAATRGAARPGRRPRAGADGHDRARSPGRGSLGVVVGERHRGGSRAGSPNPRNYGTRRGGSRHRARGSRAKLNGIRLNKLLASRGIGSRRACDALVQSGVVRINGTVVTEPGRRVEPERDRVTVRGRALPGRSVLRYFLINKPVGMITTLHDPEGRRTVRELLPPGPRLFPVGRLDADTSGLLLVTNDGELAHKLMHPRYGVEKRYRVLVDAAPQPSQLPP